MPDLEITDADVQTFQAAHQRALVSDPSYRNADMAGLTAVAEGRDRQVAAQALRDWAAEIEAHYPADVFVPGGTSPDAYGAAGVRVACNLMRYYADDLEADRA